MKTANACLAVALLFVICSKTRGDVSLTVRPERFEIVAGSQKVVFAKDEVGRFVLTTYVHSGNSWRPLFDGGMPLLQGPDFNVHPDTFRVVEDTPQRVAVSLTGVHERHKYKCQVLVEAKADSELLRFRVTCPLKEKMIISVPEPSAMLWMKERPADQLVVDQGPGSIYHGSADNQWGNSFPAAYLWADGKEAAVFFNMTPMTWMSNWNLFRFLDCRVQAFNDRGRTGLGFRAVKRNYHEIPAGDLVVEFYLYGARQPKRPTRLEALHTMIRKFTELHPSTAPLPVNRAAPGETSWSVFARELVGNLMLRDVVWDDVPLPKDEPWRDGPLFTENLRSFLRVSTDYAVGSHCKPPPKPKTVGDGWDFSTCNNYLAPWIAYNRLHRDPRQQAFIKAKVNTLPLFYDPKAGMIRHGTRYPLHVGDKAMTWQNFTFPLETMKVYHMLGRDDFDPAVAGKFLMGCRGLIEYAHNVDYVFPQWFDPYRKVPIPQGDIPELGVVREPWQIGTYAYLMCEAYETTGETRYLDEAKHSIRRLFGGMKFTVSNKRYTTRYNDPVDFPITEIFGNAWGVAAAQKLYDRTDEVEYQRFADDFLNSLLRMTYWYESELRSDEKDRVVRNAGLFRNHSGVNTGSPWETIEAYLPLTVYLKHRQEPFKLLLRLFNLQRINSFHFFPAVFGDAAIPCKRLYDHPAQYIPIENFYMHEHGGSHGGQGRAVYMSSIALWNYLLYEAFAEASDRDVMVLNLDVIDGFEEAMASVKRTFIVYNPTRKPRSFTLRMKSLAADKYRLATRDATSTLEHQTHSSDELSAGVALSLKPMQFLRVELEHTDAARIKSRIRQVETAQNRLSHTYALLQGRARDRGVNDELVRLKSAFMAAMADYRKQEYEKAGGGAAKVIATLKRSNSR